MSGDLDQAARLLAAARPTDTRIPGSGRRDEWLPPAPDQLQGLVPNLVVEALLGTGGMGAVYRARQSHLDRTVALKILRPELAGDPTFLARFARESRVMARLSHPHIVTLHDSGTAAGHAWMIMEYIPGATLRAVLAEGRLSPDEAMRLVPQICSGLQYAHDQGVVHRDLKPENILIDERGQAHLVDFGLAKLDEPGPHLTQSGQVLGTLHYIAPEQLAGDARTNHRADIYALGVLIYEMLTGTLPVGRFDPPSRHAGIDLRMDDVVLRSLERDPERRWQRVDQMTRAMDEIPAKPGGDQQRSTPPATPPAEAIAVQSPAQTVPPTPWQRLRALQRPRDGAYIAGICAALGQATPVPVWCWRAAILALLLVSLGDRWSDAGAVVILAYLVLWLSVPKAKPDGG